MFWLEIMNGRSDRDETNTEGRCFRDTKIYLWSGSQDQWSKVKVQGQIGSSEKKDFGYKA